MPMSSLRILVLEDQPIQRLYAITVLSHLGCTDILEAADGAQALAILKHSGPVDIAFCDICMEGMDGISFLQHVSQSNNLKAVVVTSDIALELRQAIGQMASLLGLRVLGELCKPLSVTAMEELIGKYLASTEVDSPHSRTLDEVTDSEVLEAFEKGEISVYYQPKFNIKTLEVTSVEALARWRHPSRGELPPSLFISVLEKLGLLDALLHQQIEDCLTLRKEAWAYGFPLKFAINVQAFQFANEGLSSQIALILKRFDAPGSSLSFEMTETGILDPQPASLENMVRLRMMGCGLSIDDFGDGYSSLQRVCRLPFNEIKVDAGFVRDLASEPRSCAAISSTLSLASELGIAVVVEGIETLEQRNILLALGCKTGQGYFLARPMPREKLLTWLINKPLDSGRNPLLKAS